MIMDVNAFKNVDVRKVNIGQVDVWKCGEGHIIFNDADLDKYKDCIVSKTSDFVILKSKNKLLLELDVAHLKNTVTGEDFDQCELTTCVVNENFLNRLDQEVKSGKYVLETPAGVDHYTMICDADYIIEKSDNKSRLTQNVYDSISDFVKEHTSNNRNFKHINDCIDLPVDRENSDEFTLFEFEYDGINNFNYALEYGNILASELQTCKPMYTTYVHKYGDWSQSQGNKVVKSDKKQVDVNKVLAAVDGVDSIDNNDIKKGIGE